MLFDMTKSEQVSSYVLNASFFLPGVGHGRWNKKCQNHNKTFCRNSFFVEITIEFSNLFPNGSLPCLAAQFLRDPFGRFIIDIYQ